MKILAFNNNFSSYKASTLLLLLVVYILTITRGIRFPNDWAEAHWLISYEFGFIKRGFVGTLFEFMTNTLSFINLESLIIFTTTTFLAIYFCLYFYIITRLLKNFNYHILSILISLILLSSAHIVLSGNLNGYFDNINISLAIISCLLLTNGFRYIVSILLLIAVLIHENFIFIGFPSVLIFSLIVLIKNNSNHNLLYLITSYIKTYWMLLAIPLIGFLCILINQELYIDKIATKELMKAHLIQYPFIEERRHVYVPHAYTHGFVHYFEGQSKHFIKRLLNEFYLLRIVFGASLLIAATYILSKKSDFKILISILMLIAIIIPIGMHAIAYDTSRIWSYTLVAAFLCIFGLSTFGINRVLQNKTVIYLAFLLLSL